MERFYSITRSNTSNTPQDKPSEDKQEFIYVKAEGEVVEGVYMECTPASIKTEKLEIKEISEGCYSHKKQGLENKIKK